jgi:hypothetical protein
LMAMAIVIAGEAAPHVGCPWRSTTRSQFSLCDRRSRLLTTTNTVASCGAEA